MYLHILTHPLSFELTVNFLKKDGHCKTSSKNLNGILLLSVLLNSLLMYKHGWEVALSVKQLPLVKVPDLLA